MIDLFISRVDGDVPSVVNSPAHAHRKSNSLDGTDRKTKQLVPPVRERSVLFYINLK